MKILNAYSPQGELLFTGTKGEIKTYLRKHRIQDVIIKEKFIEKVMEFIKEEDNSNHLAKPPNKEGWFNRIFP